MCFNVFHKLHSDTEHHPSQRHFKIFSIKMHYSLLSFNLLLHIYACITRISCDYLRNLLFYPLNRNNSEPLLTSYVYIKKNYDAFCFSDLFGWILFILHWIFHKRSIIGAQLTYETGDQRLE